MASEMTEFVAKTTDPLVVELSKDLPSDNNPNDLKRLKEMVSYAEAQRARLAKLKRRVDVVCNEKKNELTSQFEADHKDDAKKPTKDVRDMYIKAEMSEELANQSYLDELQDILKSRVSLGQSYLKSFSLETQTSYNNNELRM